MSCSVDKTKKIPVFEIDGVYYRGKAALQRAWATRSRLLSRGICRKLTAKQDGGLARVSEEDRQWYLKAAWVSDGRIKKMLYPRHSTTLEQVLEGTSVLVGRSDFFETNPDAPLQRCVFFAQETKGATSEFEQALAKSNKVYKVHKSLAGVTPKKGSARVTSMKGKLLLRMRKDIRCQIVKYRRQVQTGGCVKCSLCQRQVVLSESHIDHGTGTQSFSSIAERFVAETDDFMAHSDPQNIAWSKVRLLYLRETTIQTKWKQYHAQNARLSPTCKQCNLKQGRNRDLNQSLKK